MTEKRFELDDVSHIWTDRLSDRDRLLFAKSGYGSNAPLGKRPVLVIIDATYEFTGPSPQPILEMVKDYPNACGEEGWEAIRHIRRLIEAARESSTPVIYTVGDPQHPYLDNASWGKKNPRLMNRDFSRNEVVEEIRPLPTEPVVSKVKPSAFFGTSFSQYLTVWGADHLIVCGTTTSGCVRATVVDAFSQGLSVSVAAEACYDRGETSHAVALFDMSAKYATVTSTRSIESYLEGIRVSADAG